MAGSNGAVLAVSTAENVSSIVVDYLKHNRSFGSSGLSEVFTGSVHHHGREANTDFAKNVS